MEGVGEEVMRMMMVGDDDDVMMMVSFLTLPLLVSYRGKSGQLIFRPRDMTRTNPTNIIVFFGTCKSL